MISLRTGIDLVEINRLVSIDRRIFHRFCQRVFTPSELAEAGGNLPSLAGYFAVKEAVAKALGCGLSSIHWQDIETRKGPVGEPILILNGEALRIATSLGLTTWSISISHTRDQAVAVAVAMGDRPENG